MDAVRTLIAWREMIRTRRFCAIRPSALINGYREWFRGYDMDRPKNYPARSKMCRAYDDMVILREIDVESHCEHHIAPFLGRAICRLSCD